MDRVRLLPVLAACQALAIWLADRGDWPSGAALALGCAASLLGLILRPSATGSKFARASLACVVAFSLGAYSISVRLEEAARSRPIRATTRTVEAAIADAAWGPGWKRVELVDAIDVESAVRLGRIRVFGGHAEIPIPGLEKVAIGTRVRTRLSMRAYRGTANPGSRLRERDLARAGIGSVARLVHPALHVSVSGEARLGWMGGLAGSRKSIGSRLAKAGRGSELVRALAIGDKAGLDSHTREAFRRLGLSHLLAISGLHLALVGSLGFALFRLTVGRSAWFAARFDTRTAALLAALVLASGYALIAGWGVPVRRSLVLLFSLTLAVVRGRGGARAEPIAMASIGVLAVEPAALFDPGAQLSFAAAGALAFSASRPLRDAPATRMKRMVSVVSDAMRASASAIAATAPLAAWQFGSVAPVAPIANLFGIPWTGFVLLPTALFAAAAAGLDFRVPAIGASWIAARTLDAVAWASRFAGLWTPTSNPSAGWTLGIAVLVVCTVRVRRTGFRLGLSLAVSAALIIAAPTRIQPQPPRMVALDVGQGAASIVQGLHSAVLFDAGGSSGRGDWGRRAIVPALRALGIDRLDRIVVSHGDLDHRGGIPSVLERIDVDEVWIPYGTAESPEFAAIVEVARRRGIRLSERGEGSSAQLAGELTMTGLWPPRDGPSGSRNDRSLVVRVDVLAGAAPRGTRVPIRVLMPGDIGAATEAQLVASGADLRSDVLVLGHHGSRTSSTDGFLAAVGAQIAIASAPCAGRFGMPHPEVRRRTREADMSLWWTGRDGAVLVGLRPPLTVFGHRYGDRYRENRDGCSPRESVE